MWRNDDQHFGLATRLLHWLMAVLILALLGLGLVLVSIKPNLSTLWLYGLHKTLGITVLLLAVVRLVWHRINPPPLPIGPVNAWQTRAARLVHAALYILIIAIPLSGWIASSATGLDVVIFNLVTLPQIAPISESWEKIGFTIHHWLAWSLMTLLVAHVAAALLRAFHHDGTLRRMATGR